MVNTRIGIVAACAAVLVLAGCSFPKSSRDKAEWFFEKGSDKIVDSLEDQGVEGKDLTRVRNVLADHRSAVVKDLATAFAEQRSSFRTLYAGQDTDALLASEDASHEARRRALRSIGAMHADIEQTVGADTWAAANEQRRKRFEDRYEDE